MINDNQVLQNLQKQETNFKQHERFTQALLQLIYRIAYIAGAIQKERLNFKFILLLLKILNMRFHFQYKVFLKYSTHNLHI